MNDLKELLNLNWAEIIIGLVLLIVVVRFVWEAISWLFNKLGIKFKWKESREQDHRMIEEHSNSMETLLASNTQMITKLDILSNDFNKLKSQMDELESESGDAKLSDQEILKDRLYQRSRHFLNDLQGIPEDEYDAFKQMYNLYVKRGDGDAGLTAKVEYCFNELPILPTSQNYIINKPSNNSLAGKIIM